MWYEQYVGIPYVEEVSDCACLVRKVLLEQTGREINLPFDRDWEKKTPEQIIEDTKDYAAPTDTPKNFDGVLLRVHGDRRSVGSHVGIYVEMQRPWILHSLVGIGSVLTKISHVPRIHLELLGFYTWK